MYDEARQPIFRAVDQFTFTRNLTTGDLGPPTYRAEGSSCSGTPYVHSQSPAVHVDLPFRNTVTECTYEFVSYDPDAIVLHGISGYRQSAPMPGNLVYERARFTVLNWLGVNRDTDLNIDEDYVYRCPVIKGQLPAGWNIGCRAHEIDDDPLL